MLRADLLRPWANWVTPKEERTRRYDTYFFVGALPAASAPTARTPRPTAPTGPPRGRPGGLRRGPHLLAAAHLDQLDSLAGHTVPSCWPWTAGSSRCPRT
jgi:hypothetical protein